MFQQVTSNVSLVQKEKAPSVTTHIAKLTWLYLRNEAHRQSKTISTLLRE